MPSLWLHALLLCWPVVVESSDVAAEPVLRWSARLRGLEAEALGDAEHGRLVSEFAAAVAETLGVVAEQVQDLEGNVGQISIRSWRSPPQLAHDMRPGESHPEHRTGTGSDNSATGQPEATAQPQATRTTTTTWPQDRPFRGITYNALPCMEQTCDGRGLPSHDLLQPEYEGQWGAAGRDDLATMAQIGANAVRVYHGLGLGAEGRGRGAFLDRAHMLGISMILGYHTEAALRPDACPDFDCFEAWKAATLAGFDSGLAVGVGWHPAVHTLMLLNQPDYLELSPKCQPVGAWCRLRAVLSALDGVLAAENEAGIDAGNVRLAVSWSFSVRDSIDGELHGPGIFGFQDVTLGIADPSIVNYTPRSRMETLQEAFRTRWMHSLNTPASWSFVHETVEQVYDRFTPTPWFLGEYGAFDMSGSAIQADLETMDALANKGGDFKGAAVHQFQVAYERGGGEMNFGLFSLGNQVSGMTDKVCDRENNACQRWTVRCLCEEHDWLDDAKAYRASAVAAAWGGSLEDIASLCIAPNGPPSSGTDRGSSVSAHQGPPSAGEASTTEFISEFNSSESDADPESTSFVPTASTSEDSDNESNGTNASAPIDAGNVSTTTPTKANATDDSDQAEVGDVAEDRVADETREGDDESDNDASRRLEGGDDQANSESIARTDVSSRLDCIILELPENVSVDEARVTLGSSTLAERIVARAVAALGKESDAAMGELSLVEIVTGPWTAEAVKKEKALAAGEKTNAFDFPWWGWAIIAFFVLALMLWKIISLSFGVLCRRQRMGAAARQDYMASPRPSDGEMSSVVPTDGSTVVLQVDCTEGKLGEAHDGQIPPEASKTSDGDASGKAASTPEVREEVCVRIEM